MRLLNDTGSTITSFDISYIGEQWRNSAAAAQTVAFSYLVGAPTVTGSFAEFDTSPGIVVPELNFTSPITAGLAGALDGNIAPNRTAISFEVIGLSIPDGTEVMLRWADPDHTGADHGLAIDDVSITPHGTSPLPTLTIADVSQNEANAGTSNFHFTVSLSAPAPVGGVTFNIATADDGAEAGTDYTAFSANGVVIAEGNLTHEFDVVVSGDAVLEVDEDFLVNITAITGANPAATSATGTIVNDDAGVTLSITDASVLEGSGGGTTPLVFTVSLDNPAPIGGVGFTINTTDDTALAASDYTVQTAVLHTILAGETSYEFSVPVGADTEFEPNETFNVILSDVTNAVGGDTVVGTITNDDAEPLDLIHDIQGSGAATPVPGTTVTIEGVVTGDYQTQGTGQLRRFFVQEEDTDVDADPATSEGIFVFCSSCPDAVAEGQVVEVTGAVSEFNGSTQITASSGGSVVVVDAGNNLADVTATVIDLPVVGDVNAFHEARESMLVTYSDTLKVSEYFQLARYGTVTLYAGDRPRQFTADNAPSVPGLTAHLAELATRRVILDDTDNGVLNLPDTLEAIFHPRANGGFGVGTQGPDFFRGGDEVANLTGVLHWSFAGTGSADAWRIRPTAAAPVAFTAANPRPATAPVVGGAIKAAGANVLNYFSTVDAGPNICGPAADQDCRGADSVVELNRQRERTSIVLCGLNADVQGLIEIENHASGAALTDLIAAVNARCGGAHPYALAGSNASVGTDAIRVALIYRTGVLAPVGTLQIDNDAVHNRPPNAQTFDVVDANNPAFGERFTAIVNHFKSKGCGGASGGDVDAGDGQSCFAETRTAQAERLVTWINGTVVPAAGDPDVLVLGDLNSNAMEDPIIALAAGGYTDLMTLVAPEDAYSYLFNGQLGHLDYALANDTLLGQVVDMAPWHINADEVPVLDYNDTTLDAGESSFERKPDGSALVPPRILFEASTPYRGADHDPVLVGLFPIINANVGIAISDSPDPVTAGTELVYSVTVDNVGPDAAEDVEWSGTLPTNTRFVSLVSDAGWSCSTPAVDATGDVSCSRASFPVGEDEFTVTVTVDESVAQDTVLDYTVAVASGSVDSDSSNDDATASTTVNAAPEGLLVIDPTSLPFGDVIVGDTSAPSFVTLSNVGDATLEITALTTATAPFERDGGTCSETLPIVIAAGTDCTIGYRFSPTVEGTANLDITVTADAPGSGAVELSGTGEAAPAADVSVTIDDGRSVVGVGETLDYVIVVSNATGPSTATVTVEDVLPAELGDGLWDCVATGAGASCGSGTGDTLTDIATLPAGTFVTYVFSATVQAETEGLTIENEVSATVDAGVDDPNLLNNVASDSNLVENPIFSDGFETTE